MATTKAELARDSSYSSVAVDAGAGLARNNLGVLMDGEGSSTILDGLYLVGNSQHVDNEVIIDHKSPHTTSRELYKGILDGKSRSVFHGSVIVREGAQKVDARQADKNLLLSRQAEADTKPAFWIYADDVKCGHGAANGQLDENALFYLRCRGLDEAAARQMLVRAFASEIVDKIKLAPFRTYVDRVVMKVLPQLRPTDN
jgi:Fe-S cluster assembly protein SufD